MRSPPLLVPVLSARWQLRGNAFVDQSAPSPRFRSKLPVRHGAVYRAFRPRSAPRAARRHEPGEREHDEEDRRDQPLVVRHRRPPSLPIMIHKIRRCFRRFTIAAGID